MTDINSAKGVFGTGTHLPSEAFAFKEDTSSPKKSTTGDHRRRRPRPCRGQRLRADRPRTKHKHIHVRLQVQNKCLQKWASGSVSLCTYNPGPGTCLPLLAPYIPSHSSLVSPLETAYFPLTSNSKSEPTGNQVSSLINPWITQTFISIGALHPRTW